MFLKDRGYINQDEPFQKLINQGMILGMSAFVSRIEASYDSDITNFIDGIDEVIFPENIFISKKYLDSIQKYKNEVLQKKSQNIPFYEVEKPKELLEVEEFYFKTMIELNPNSKAVKELEGCHFEIYKQQIHVDISLLKGTTDELDIEAFKKWRAEFADAEFILEDGKYITEREVEKMSKSKYNVVNPDDICEEYGADCLRLYEMFLGPLEQSKPWNTQGLSGVYGFLKKFYNLYFDGDNFSVSDEEPTKAELKVLHTLIKKFTFDIQNFSFNTSVSQFMIAVNELQKMKCNKRAILEPLAVIISPYAPHICEELWEKLGKNPSIEFEKLPELNEAYLVEDEINYPVSFNGKMKFTLALAADLDAKQIEEIAMSNEKVQEILAGATPKKIIIVPKKIINIVF